MCEICNTADQHALVSEARAVADRLLGDYLRVRVAKGMILGTPGGFDKAVANLARLLQGKASASDHDAVKAATGSPSQSPADSSYSSRWKPPPIASRN